MAYDYDRLYAETPDALGPPTPAIARFFEALDRRGARVLDIGCGQGRDALFIARLGHSVVGVDLAPHGIRDMVASAEAEALPIEGIVADIADHAPDGTFDVILIDRTLHMLARPARLRVLSGLLDHTVPGGWLVIADEPSNMADFEATLAAHPQAFRIQKPERGLLIAHRS